MDIALLLDGALWAKIGFSVLCGAIIGIERQSQKKPIDVRTSVLICLGTAIFIHLSELLNGNKDSTRVLGQVVTGIGFLGAGAIFTRQEGYVVGLTSASVVWVLAAVGAAIGFSEYEVGVVVTLVTLFVLIGLQFLENLAEKTKKNSRV